VPRSGPKHEDETLLWALACGATVENAAAKAGLSERTAFRRLKDPTFQRRLQDTTADMVQRTAGMLTAGGLEASKTLIGLLGPSNSEAVRLRAAKAIVELSLKMRELADLQGRVASLERQMAAGNSS
jgi:hypothetical protein